MQFILHILSHWCCNLQRKLWLRSWVFTQQVLQNNFNESSRLKAFSLSRNWHCENRVKSGNSSWIVDPAAIRHDGNNGQETSSTDFKQARQRRKILSLLGHTHLMTNGKFIFWLDYVCYHETRFPKDGRDRTDTASVCADNRNGEPHRVILCFNLTLWLTDIKNSICPQTSSHFSHSKMGSF